MDPYDTQNRSKVAEYPHLVEARVLKPLASEAVQQSCSATLLLAFAAVDALGKLVHPDNQAFPGMRFRAFLSFMGPEYEERFKELWNLRNAFVHNAINVEACLSSTELEGWAHLKRIGGSGFIYVNTGLVSSDLAAAFGRLTVRLRTDEATFRRADDRLKWLEDTQEGTGDEALPTQPPQVQFVYARRQVARPSRRKGFPSV
jgi:hypothetical protein